MTPPTLTAIQDTLYTATGAPLEGEITITNTAFTDSNGNEIGAGMQQLAISQGDITLALVSNAGSTPPTLYVVDVLSAGNDQWPQYWLIPATGGPYRLSQIQATPPTPPPLIPPDSE